MTELTMAAVAPPRQQDEVRRYPATYADYLAWPDESAIVEWKDGEIIEHMPPTEQLGRPARPDARSRRAARRLSRPLRRPQLRTRLT